MKKYFILLYCISQALNASSYWDCKVKVSDNGSYSASITVEVKAKSRSEAERKALYARSKIKHWWKIYDVCSVWEDDCRFKIYETEYCNRQ